jgi:hypothetical protein
MSKKSKQDGRLNACTLPSYDAAALKVTSSVQMPIE